MKKVIWTSLAWLVGTLAALSVSLVMDATAIRRDVDVFRAAYRLPSAIVAPVFFLNFFNFHEQLYIAHQWNAAKVTGRFLSATEEDREKALEWARVQAPLWSGLATVAFWGPFWLIRTAGTRRKKAEFTTAP